MSLRWDQLHPLLQAFALQWVTAYLMGWAIRPAGFPHEALPERRIFTAPVTQASSDSYNVAWEFGYNMLAMVWKIRAAGKEIAVFEVPDSICGHADRALSPDAALVLNALRLSLINDAPITLQAQPIIMEAVPDPNDPTTVKLRPVEKFDFVFIKDKGERSVVRAMNKWLNKCEAPDCAVLLHYAGPTLCNSHLAQQS